MSRWKRYLSNEIGIEFKACLYFFCILFFYSIFQIVHGSWWCNIIVMTEMIFTTYVMGYVQLLCLKNFDEGEKFGLQGCMYSILCSGIYTGISFLGKWFSKDLLTTVLFFLYLMFVYVCAFGVYKIKREIDTKELNKDLEEFKKRRKE